VRRFTLFAALSCAALAIWPGGGSAASGATASSILLASSLERPVCGRAFTPGPGCEFGVEGNVIEGSYGPRTGAGDVRIDREGILEADGQRTHMGVIAEVNLPSGHAFVGSAHRVPGFAPNEVEYIQLAQITPSDGSGVAWPVEVRMYTATRRLGLALWLGSQVAKTTWAAPVDRWFDVVVEVARSDAATLRLWVFDDADRLVDQVSIVADTIAGDRGKARQKVGGTISTNSPMYTYADDWYFATTNLGPHHVT